MNLQYKSLVYLSSNLGMINQIFSVFCPLMLLKSVLFPHYQSILVEWGLVLLVVQIISISFNRFWCFIDVYATSSLNCQKGLLECF